VDAGLAIVAGLFTVTPLYRFVTIWNDLPPHLEALRRPRGNHSLLRSTLKYLGVLGLFWLGMTLILTGGALEPGGATTLEGPARTLVIVGLVVVLVSLLLLATIRIWGRPRTLVPPALRD